LWGLHLPAKLIGRRKAYVARKKRKRLPLPTLDAASPRRECLNSRRAGEKERPFVTLLVGKRVFLPEKKNARLAGLDYRRARREPEKKESPRTHQLKGTASLRVKLLRRG